MVEPKYSHVERERRWRVELIDAPDFADRSSAYIEDRYLDGSRFRLRRMTDNTWSLDKFEEPAVPFVILEIEAEEDLLGILDPPCWAGQEVTELKSYECGSLVRKPDPVE